MSSGWFAQTRNVPVTHKCRLQFAVAVFLRTRDSEIENAHAIPRFALIDATITGADHHPLAGFLFAAQVNHRVSNRWIAIDGVSAGPEKKIARLQIFQLERIILSTDHRLEFSGAPKPDVLLT